MTKKLMYLCLVLTIIGTIFRFIFTGHDLIGYGFYLLTILILVYKLASVKIRIAVTIIMTICIAMFCYFIYPVIVSAKTDAPDDCDYIIVLGAGLNGETPSLSLINRLEPALEYLEENPETIAIVTGGQGEGETITEALAMKRYLVENGISEDRIIMEDMATSTLENLEFSFDIIENLGGTTDNVAIVTSEYHLHRAKLMAETLGVSAYGIAGHTSYPTLMLNYFAREAIAMAYYTIFGGL